MTETNYDLIILGSGPAGLTAAVYASRANLRVLVAHGPQPGGQLTTTTEVENFPGFPEGVLGPDLMENMRKQAERFGAAIVQQKATRVDLKSRPFTVAFDGREESCRALVIATGASAKTLGLEDEWNLMGYGLSTCATCDGAFFRDQEIVVVGGGDSACEEALFLTKFGKRVRLVHRRDELRASKIMAQRVLNHPKIEVLWNSTVVKLLGDKQTGLRGAVLANLKSGERSEIECSGLFYGIGHTPNTGLFKGVLKLDEAGYIITEPNSTVTNIPGVFACGDVRDHVFRQAITAAGSGCMAAIEAERFLAED
jgi:thioredoxin reductase (NADPH)